jgi:hypothetical protein
MSEKFRQTEGIGYGEIKEYLELSESLGDQLVRRVSPMLIADVRDDVIAQSRHIVDDHQTLEINDGIERIIYDRKKGKIDCHLAVTEDGDKREKTILGFQQTSEGLLLQSVGLGTNWAIQYDDKKDAQRLHPYRSSVITFHPDEISATQLHFYQGTVRLHTGNRARVGYAQSDTIGKDTSRLLQKQVLTMDRVPHYGLEMAINDEAIRVFFANNPQISMSNGVGLYSSTRTGMVEKDDSRKSKREPDDFGVILESLMERLGISEEDLVNHSTFSAAIRECISQPFCPLESQGQLHQLVSQHFPHQTVFKS